MSIKAVFFLFFCNVAWEKNKNKNKKIVLLDLQLLYFIFLDVVVSRLRFRHFSFTAYIQRGDS